MPGSADPIYHGAVERRHDFVKKTWTAASSYQLQVHLFGHLVNNKAKFEPRGKQERMSTILHFYLRAKMVSKKLSFGRWGKRAYFWQGTIWFAIYKPLNCNCVRCSQCKWRLRNCHLRLMTRIFRGYIKTERNGRYSISGLGEVA